MNLSDIFNTRTYRDESQWYHIDWEVHPGYVEDWVLPYVIQMQYEKAISRTSDYIGNLEDHLVRGCAQYLKYKNSYLVGNYNHEWGVFVVSHFAPKSLREGMEMMKYFYTSNIPITLAVPHYQAKQLIRLGWEWVGLTYQPFNGSMVMKVVLTSKFVSNSTWYKLKDTLSKLLPLLRPCPLK